MLRGRCAQATALVGLPTEASCNMVADRMLKESRAPRRASTGAGLDRRSLRQRFHRPPLPPSTPCTTSARSRNPAGVGACCASRTSDRVGHGRGATRSWRRTQRTKSVRT